MLIWMSISNCQRKNQWKGLVTRILQHQSTNFWITPCTCTKTCCDKQTYIVCSLNHEHFCSVIPDGGHSDNEVDILHFKFSCDFFVYTLQQALYQVVNAVGKYCHGFAFFPIFISTNSLSVHPLYGREYISNICFRHNRFYIVRYAWTGSFAIKW